MSRPTTASTPLSTNRYLPDVLHPQGWENLIEFSSFPWPTWTFRITATDLIVRQEILVARDTCETVLRWSVAVDCPHGCRLTLRLLMSGRDYHALHRKNGSFDFLLFEGPGRKCGAAALRRISRGDRADERKLSQLIRSGSATFFTSKNASAVSTHVEDLASPGVFTWNLDAPARRPWCSGPGDSLNVRTESLCLLSASSARSWRRREAADRFALALPVGQLSCRSWWGAAARCSPAILGSPIGAATPSLPCAGCARRAHHSEAARILSAGQNGLRGDASQPLRRSGDAPEFNSVDASLWFVVAVHEFCIDRRRARASDHTGEGETAVCRVRGHFARLCGGTRFGIRADAMDCCAPGEPESS